MIGLVKRHPLASYFGLAYALSWAVMIPVAASAQGWIRASVHPALYYVASLGPMISALILSAITSGGAGLRELLQGLLQWRVPFKYLAFSVLAPVGLFAAACLIDRAATGSWPDLRLLGEIDYLPRLGVPGVLGVWFVTYGLGEEIGWRGFALPHLQRRWSARTSALVLGVAWAGWHLPAFFFRDTYQAMGLVFFPVFVMLMAFTSVVFTWLYNGTRGSLLIMILFHVMFNWLSVSEAGGPWAAMVMGAPMVAWAVRILKRYPAEHLSAEKKHTGLPGKDGETQWDVGVRPHSSLEGQEQLAPGVNRRGRRRFQRWIGAVLVGLGVILAGLTNLGWVSTRTPYIRQASPEAQAWSGPTAFINVNLIPMEREEVLEGMTVVVEDGRIAAVGRTGEVTIPAQGLQIDGTGRYLMPGLVDMHIHLGSEDNLLLLLANGVTAARDMWGNTGVNLALGLPDQLTLRRQILQGTLLGPRLYVAGPIMEGDPPTMPLMPVIGSPDEARSQVAWQAGQGYDFVKVYDHLSPEVYNAILQAADERGLPVVGHVPEAVGLEAALRGGQLTIEHLTGYVDPDAAALIIPETDLAVYARRTKASEAWNTPTLIVYTKLVAEAQAVELENDPRLRFVSPLTRATWRLFSAQERRARTYSAGDYTDRIASINAAVTTALHQAGAGLLLGTDANNPYVLWGFAVHEELKALVQAGLTPYEALAAGTRNAAEALGAEAEFGTVAPGRRADLLLLNANPLADVTHAGDRAGVMAGGRWFAQATLDAMLEGLSRSFRPSLFDRLWPLALVVVGVLAIGGSRRAGPVGPISMRPGGARLDGTEET